MKIDPKTQNLARVQEIKHNPEDRLMQFKPSRNSSPKTVDISSLASELARMEEDARNVPDVRTEKVQQIQKSIQDGTYAINEEKLADVLSKFI